MKDEIEKTTTVFVHRSPLRLHPPDEVYPTTVPVPAKKCKERRSGEFPPTRFRVKRGAL
jgi:hypothetical protein